MTQGVRAQRQAETRKTLLSAAAAVFAREGYGGASVRQIAAQAGCTHGAVYSNFAGKEDLFLALHEEFVANRVREAVAAWEAGAEGLASRARAAADQWMESVAERPEHFLLALEFSAFAARRPALRQRFALRQAAVGETLSRLYAEAAEEEGIELQPPARELGLLVQALGAGLARESITDPEAVRPGLYGEAVALLVDHGRED